MLIISIVKSAQRLLQTDLAVTHAILTQLTVPHLETKEEPNFVNTSCT